MTEFLQISNITIPISCIESVYKHLRYAGKNGFEGVALFAGILQKKTFEIKTTIIPRQTAERIENGLLYSVDGEELHRINVWLYENKMTLIAQIHSHPGEAYHSDTDDRFPIITEFGGLSIVVPNFAFYPFLLADWVVYQLNLQKDWVELSKEQVSTLLKIHY